MKFFPEKKFLPGREPLHWGTIKKILKNSSLHQVYSCSIKPFCVEVDFREKFECF